MEGQVQWQSGNIAGGEEEGLAKLLGASFVDEVSKGDKAETFKQRTLLVQTMPMKCSLLTLKKNVMDSKPTPHTINFYFGAFTDK